MILRKIINLLFQSKPEKKYPEFKELDFNKNGEILIENSNVKGKEEYEEVVRYTSNNKNKLSQTEIANVIDINIKFLENLLIKLEKSLYIEEYNKVQEMLNQSITCKKVLMNLKNSQIFYKNTMEIIKKHTININKLTKLINKLESSGRL